jgi:hypothetical protein
MVSTPCPTSSPFSSSVSREAASARAAAALRCSGASAAACCVDNRRTRVHKRPGTDARDGSEQGGRGWGRGRRGAATVTGGKSTLPRVRASAPSPWRWWRRRRRRRQLPAAGDWLGARWLAAGGAWRLARPVPRCAAPRDRTPALPPRGARCRPAPAALAHLLQVGRQEPVLALQALVLLHLCARSTNAARRSTRAPRRAAPRRPRRAAPRRGRCPAAAAPHAPASRLP